MHLKQLKLAGFKSFVDPTVVPFLGQRVAVVGPNGCGKSNIIDAVRWVMGESHAKNLRGESIVDVIFKGSSGRKPIGQASVELLFDNSLGRLTGQYASYQEISVKRLVTKDGESSYYLNGTRCRRRDITDIFLGTGAGARGYSIIGQDTISRLIEARPEELRAYLEEAAGVSKYKERRRETVQRIQVTRDNLTRVADIISELDKQIVRLERQAKAALRYRALKQDERLCRAEMIAHKWQIQTETSQKLQMESREIAQHYDQHQTLFVSLCKESEVVRDKVGESLASHQTIQVQFYQLATEIARLEEAIQQRTRNKERLVLDKAQLMQDIQELNTALQLDQTRLEALDQLTITLQANVLSLQVTFEAQEQKALHDEHEKNKLNTTWQEANMALERVYRDIALQEVHIENLEARRQAEDIRLEKTQVEWNAIDLDRLSCALIALEGDVIELFTAHESATNLYQQGLNLSAGWRHDLSLVISELYQAQDKTKTLAMEHAALSAALTSALYGGLDKNQLLDNKKRVAELTGVEEAWVLVAECVLGDRLQAIVFDSIDEVWPMLPSLVGQSYLLLEQAVNDPKVCVYPTLADKLTTFIPSGLPSLDSLFAAESLEEAATWLPTLNKTQSIVTQDGYWLGQGWVRVLKLVPEEEAGLLSRKYAVASLSTALEVAEEGLAHLMGKRDALHTLITNNEQHLDVLKQTVADTLLAKNERDTQLTNQQQRLKEAVTRKEALSIEREQGYADREELVASVLELTDKRHLLQAQAVKYAAIKEDLFAKKISWDAEVLVRKNELEVTRAAYFQEKLQLGQEASKKEQLRDNIARSLIKINTLEMRIDGLNQQALALNEPEGDQGNSLLHKMMQHTKLESDLTIVQHQVDAFQRDLQDLIQRSKHEEQQAIRLQDARQRIVVEMETAGARAAVLCEALDEMEMTLQSVLEGLVPDVSLVMRKQTLQAIDEKINRLGAINLLAIEEYQTDLARKQLLESQYNDLSEALGTLDNAIAKLDKETEQKLMETFLQVNTSFQTLFPRLFGGGHAKLELTCGNLLEAGILVMAQPPGKRNNTIHMLSGGEKAMTAIALVFAIFQQNPSPFCMLDEVDAPLDETNVRRFCDLVKDMSQFVQFLFITHNKVTMALADHLIGITMREPGVSRVVTVDVLSMVD